MATVAFWPERLPPDVYVDPQDSVLNTDLDISTHNYILLYKDNYGHLNMIGRKHDMEIELWLVTTADETQRGDGLSLVWNKQHLKYISPRLAQRWDKRWHDTHSRYIHKTLPLREMSTLDTYTKHCH